MSARAAWRAALLALVVASPGPARAAVQPDPGNAAAWASGLALLAEPPGALALFDQPAGLAAGPRPRLAVGVARTRPFGLDALARTRLAVAASRGEGRAALGVETHGPPGARRTRLGLGAAWRRGGPGRDLVVGAAWHEARRPAGPGATARSGALDLGGIVRRGRLAAALAARSLWSGGAAVARADPDWTIESSAEVAPARLHLALTHDLAGTRIGGGVALRAGPLTVRAGAFGAPWSWAFGLAAGGGRARGAATRSEHPALGPSEAWDGEVAW